MLGEVKTKEMAQTVNVLLHVLVKGEIFDVSPTGGRFFWKANVNEIAWCVDQIFL